MKDHTWSKPYYGLTHYGTIYHERWGTLRIFPSGHCIATKHIKGIPYSEKMDSHFDTIEQGKEYIENWVENYYRYL